MSAATLTAYDEATPDSAERQLSLVVITNPVLTPEGWCDELAAITDAVRFRARPDVVLKPKLAEAFAWCRTFLALGCRKTPITRICGDRSTLASRLAFEAEMAAQAINGRQLPIEQGVAIAAALSLEIEVERDGRHTWIGTRPVWKGRR